MKNDEPSILLMFGLRLMLFSILFLVRKINLPFFVCILWSFLGVIMLDVAIDKMIKIKNEMVVHTSIMILYFFGLILALYWYNPHHIIVSPVLCIVGFTLNYAVTAVNGGKMPVCIPQVWIMDTHLYVAMKNTEPDKTKWNILGDWIPSSANLTSPGDVMIDIGPLCIAIEIFFFV